MLASQPGQQGDQSCLQQRDMDIYDVMRAQQPPQMPWISWHEHTAADADGRPEPQHADAIFNRLAQWRLFAVAHRQYSNLVTPRRQCLRQSLDMMRQARAVRVLIEQDNEYLEFVAFAGNSRRQVSTLVASNRTLYPIIFAPMD